MTPITKWILTQRPLPNKPEPEPEPEPPKEG